ncbi:MAG TPA: hypothetical protein VJK51_00185 [Candidatus Nanoarchaeia archaeon]|nr:hypothetical protein [Candidatus Nanoarchaeia archaeon]
MSLETNFIFLVIFGLVGWAIERVYDFDPVEYWVKFGSISVLVSLFIAYIPAIYNPNDVVNNIDRIANWFMEALPGTIIGDLAGLVVSKMTGGRDE